MPNQLTSIPNLITYARIVAVPVVCWLLVTGDTTLRWVGLVLYIAAALSDFLDGYLARKLNQGSPLGKMLDPIADKLLVNALLIVLAFTGDFDAWDLIPAVAIMLRETLVPGLREYLGNARVEVPVTLLAKWKTTTQLIALAVVILAGLIPGLGLVADLVLWLAAALTVITGAQYFASAWPHLSERTP
jgi:CDP-diacylglycerol--glycerol-3-phosphate 3-phosphatidyltransferase